MVFQQVSQYSGKPDTYEPYLGFLLDYARERCPKGVRLYLHQTWAYAKDSTHPNFPDYGCDRRRMYELLKAAYAEAAESIGAGLIPVGDTVQFFRENVPGFDYPNGGESLCRDGFHLSIPAGRYLASLVWLETLAGVDARKSVFLPEGMEEEGRVLLTERVHEYLNGIRG